jgi:hypothetical protein
MMGNGHEPDRKMLHDPGYDFNDKLLLKVRRWEGCWPSGFWLRL